MVKIGILSVRLIDVVNESGFGFFGYKNKFNFLKKYNLVILPDFSLPIVMSDLSAKR